MLLWINGPFGGGKSTTARELQSRLPGSLICDPELLGLGLQRMLPPELRSDFQDFPAWRQGVYEVLDLALRSAGGTVIATASLGLATQHSAVPFESAVQLLEAADSSVYAAKRQGRNRLVPYDPKDLPGTSQLPAADATGRGLQGGPKRIRAGAA